eukprot:SAG11_NODE_1661_length_4497_cov_5.237608_2_plen_37_part_00
MSKSERKNRWVNHGPSLHGKNCRSNLEAEQAARECS